MAQCQNNKTDREKGQYWELQFCQMAATWGFSSIPFQLGREKEAAFFFTPDFKRHILPDVVVWKNPGQYQYHEIKHKNPTSHGSFSLEAYRLDALLQLAEMIKQPVLYTIHNHDLAGGCEVRENNIAHWVTIDIRMLHDPYESVGPSWANGTMQMVKMFYWPTSYWFSLGVYWKGLK